MRAPSTSAGYDLWAPTYDAHDNPLIAQTEVALAELPWVFHGARVLELGCGTGRLAAPILAAGAASYTGVDGSAGMLERARAAAPAQAAFALGELGAPPVAAGAHDVVLFCLVLEHVRELGPALAAAAVALRPGGLLVALELHAELAARGTGAHFEHRGQTITLESYPHDAAELRAACAHAGLTPTRLTDWFPDERSVARSAKLARYWGTPVLVELRAVKPRPEEVTGTS